MEKKTVDFQLSEVLEYSHKGEFEKTGTIIMNAPSPDVFEQSINLSQLVMRAFTDAQKLRDNISDEDIAKAREIRSSGDDEPMGIDEIKMLLLSSESIRFVDIAKEFKLLAIKVCEVAVNIKMESALFDKLSIDDHTNLICAYIANFITPSLL